MWFSSSVVIPRTSSSVRQHTCQNQSFSTVRGLSTSSLSRISRWKHSGLLPGISTCLFISVKARVPQRTVASCCILASFHWDVEDCYPPDRLAVNLSLSLFLFVSLFSFTQLITVCFFFTFSLTSALLSWAHVFLIKLKQLFSTTETQWVTLLLIFSGVVY